MKAPTLGEDFLASQAPDDKLAPVTADRGIGKAWDVPVGDPDRIPDPVREPAQSGAQHYGHLWPTRYDLPSYRFSCCLDLVHRVALPLLVYFATSVGSSGRCSTRRSEPWPPASP